MQLAATIPANEARTNFYQLLEEVGTNLRRFVITHRGKTKAVVMPIEDVEAWEETLDILSDKKLMKDLKESDRDIKNGRVISLDDLKIKYNL
jgi:antitoxin YefM